MARLGEIGTLYTVGGDVSWCAATVENSMEVPQKIKNRIII